MNKNVFVIPDVHVPYHDKKAWSLCLSVVEEVKPDVVVVIGDFADFYSISTFDKDPSRNLNLKWEVACVNAELDRLCQAAGNSQVVFLEGNHEDRLRRYLWKKAPELFGLTNTRELFKIGERGWKFIKYGDFYRRGRVTYVHDLGKSGLNALSQTLDLCGGNVVFGHTHRAGLLYRGHHGSQGHFGLNVGWLGDYRKLNYIHRIKAEREWRLGFGIVEESGNLAFSQFCPIISGRCRVFGKEYGSGS